MKKTAIDDFGEMALIALNDYEFQMQRWNFDYDPNYRWDFGKVEKIWIDPKDVKAPIKLENVFWLILYRDAFICKSWPRWPGWPAHFSEAALAKMQEIGPMMNIENHGNLLKVLTTDRIWLKYFGQQV